MSNFAANMWFMTLDMASGFWAVPMTARAQLISAFICQLGHFQWKCMPFGLKNAPLIYQQLLDNCLWGFVRLPPAEERLVDPEVLEFLGISHEDSGAPVSQGTEPRGAVVSRTTTDTMFHQNRVAPEQMGRVLSRSSYIDDMIYGAPSWDDMCKMLNALLYRLRYWNISVSLPKSEFGVKKCKYLGHDISSDGIWTSPKLAQKVLDLPFPKTQKGVQSFLGSLNYYAKFNEGLPVLAATLYEASDEQLRSGRDLEKPKHAFKILKDRLVSTPLLQHPDPRETDHDGTILPVRFVGRVLQDADLRYHPAEKEVLVLLRVLNTCHTMITSCSEKKIRVYIRYSVLTVDGRCLKWAVNLSPWDLDIRRVENDEDGLVAILGAGISPRERLDEVAETLGFRIKTPLVSLEMLFSDHIRHLLSFDGAAKRDGSGALLASSRVSRVGKLSRPQDTFWRKLPECNLLDTWGSKNWLWSGTPDLQYSGSEASLAVPIPTF
ncbi:reverse transcriptase [Phytophthora megakarya]|uniref:Reverse transcriptase n=1 Tax=Phytophthora megakarya TaxID=4795 RepID=A0A225VJ32_9STRA|nr:reverse transcriptase [Phytophthora megakarya]